MKTLIVTVMAAAALLGAAPTASAAPVSAASLLAPESGVAAVRYMRGKPAMRRYGSRRPMARRLVARRSYAPSQAGNARNPSAPVNQQQQGQTTGGPRY